MTADSSSGVLKHLRHWVGSGEVTTAFGLVARGPSVLWQGGISVRDPQPQASTLFDLASLTKPHVATLALLLDQRGVLDLAEPLGSVWPDCDSRMARITLEELLRHRSRLQAWHPFYKTCRSPRDVEAKLLSGELLGGRLGVYCDLGYILWGLAAETRLQASLGEIFEMHLARPMSLARIRSGPVARGDVAPCECGNAKEVELAQAMGLEIEPRSGPRRGRVQDGNAGFLGSLGGHAGLFGCATDLLRFANHWLTTLAGGDSLLRRKGATAALAAVGGRRLGWTARLIRGSAGRSLSPSSFGHDGFTGTSLWIDPETEAVMILLAHRRSPFSNLNVSRRRFHRLAADLIAHSSAGA